MAKTAAVDPHTSGLIVKKGDNPIQNPVVAVAEKAAPAMVKYAAEFGLTPAARSRVRATDTTPESKFEGLIAS